MIEIPNDSKHMQVLATKIEHLGLDIVDMKEGITQLAAAVTKLAVVEERQTHKLASRCRPVPSPRFLTLST
jgi:hypothetical protein